MRVLITGGRDYKDFHHIRNALVAFQLRFGKITELIHGGAPGADTIAGDEARKLGIPVTVVKPDYRKYRGHLAPLMRNQAMVDMKPDYCIPFPGGNGTKDCCKRVMTAKIPFYVHKKPLV